MTVHRILLMGNEHLKRVSANVDDPTSEKTRRLVDDLLDTINAVDGNGLAAPQIGVGLRVFTFDVDDELGHLVNPELTLSEETQHGDEGCLSIPDLRGLVPRHPTVRVQGLDREGRPLDYAVSGFEARIVQHEYDHLNGVVFLDRMRDLRSLAYFDEWENYLVGRTNPDLDETAVG